MNTSIISFIYDIRYIVLYVVLYFGNSWILYYYLFIDYVCIWIWNGYRYLFVKNTEIRYQDRKFRNFQNWPKSLKFQMIEIETETKFSNHDLMSFKFYK